MRLEYCQIENFGCLSHYRQDFYPGFWPLLAENGWGKSTLAAFLTAMLYGLDYKSRTKDIYERSRYLPWNKGKFGGELAFTAQGKRYLVQRFFGEKKSQDSFRLWDRDSHTPCRDFDENLGLALFGLDKESFRRCCHIHPEAPHPAMNAGLQQGLARRLEMEALGEGYDPAIAALDQAALKIKAKRGSGGLLGLWEKERMDLRQKEDMALLAIQKAAGLRGEIEVGEAELASLEERRSALLALSQEQALQAKAQAYYSLKDLCSGWEEKKAQAERLFPQGLPSPEALSSLRSRIQEIQRLELQKEQFLQGEDKQDFLLRWKNTVRRDASEAARACLAEDGDLQNISRELELWKSQAKDIENPAKTDSPSLLSASRLLHPAILASCLLALCLLGLSLVWHHPSWPAWMLRGLAPLCLLPPLLFLRKRRLAQARRREQSLQHARTEILTLERLYQSLYKDKFQTHMERLQSEQAHAQGVLEQFSSLETQIEENTRLLESAWDAYDFSSLADQIPAEADARWELLQSRRQSALALAQQLEESRLQLARMEEDPDHPRLPPAGAPPALPSDPEALKRLDQRIQELARLLGSQKQSLEALEEEADGLPQWQAQRMRLQEQMEEAAQTHEALLLTASYLSRAKERLSASYLPLLERSFQRHLSALCPDLAPRIQIDAQLAYRLRGEGEFWPMEHMSQGQGQLCRLALQLALVDALFGEDGGGRTSSRPPLILDDPLAYMDQGTAGLALDFLLKLSEKYQILYFTCHPSRMPQT